MNLAAHLRVASFLALCALISACATLPADPAARALYTDLRKAVDIHETTPGWIVDRIELEQLEPAALESICRSAEVTRRRLDAWLGHRIEEKGGSGREIFKRTGDLDDARASLTYERVQLLLRHAERHAEGDCPFWLAPRLDFPGLHSDDGRALLMLETNGIAALHLGRGGNAVGGGGGGRLLVGYGVHHRLTLAAGLGLGGGADLAEDPTTGDADIDASFRIGAPLIVRFHDLARTVDLELTPTSSFLLGERVWPMGLRAAVGLGLTGRRIHGLMPHFVMWAGYEHQPRRGPQPPSHSLLVGARVGFDYGL